MFTCGDCQGTITAEIQKGIVYYHCNHYRDCKQKKYIPEKVLEEKLLGVFKFFEQITPQEAKVMGERIKENHQQEIEYKENLIKTLEGQFNRLQTRMDRGYIDYLDGGSKERWEKLQIETKNQQEDILHQLQKLKTEEAKYFEIWVNILDLARRAREIYEKRTPEERRLLLSHIFSNLVLTDEKIELTLKKPVEILAKRVQERIDSEIFFEPEETLTAQGANSGSHSKSDVLPGYKDSNLN